MRDFNRLLIDELRAGGGQIASGPMAGRPLLVLTTTGAHSGEPREAVLTFTRDGDRYVVAATAGARAKVADDAERQRLWTAHVAERPEFAGYPEQTGRVIPVITLERVGDN